MEELDTLEFLTGVLCGVVLSAMFHFTPVYLEGVVVFAMTCLVTVVSAKILYRMFMGE
jgi:hypothetical protein